MEEESPSPQQQEEDPQPKEEDEEDAYAAAVAAQQASSQRRWHGPFQLQEVLIDDRSSIIGARGDQAVTLVVLYLDVPCMKWVI